MYIYVTTLIVFVVLLLLFLFRKKMKGHEHVLNFTISICATFIGVLWGIFFTDIENSKEEKIKTINLIKATKEELRLQEEKINLLLSHENEFNDTSTIVQNQLTHPIAIPRLLSKILESDDILNNLTTDTYGKLIVSLENIGLYDTRLKTDSLTNYGVYFYLNCIKIECGYSKTILSNELKYQNNDIDINELKTLNEKCVSFKEFIDKLNFGSDSLIVSHFTPDIPFKQFKKNLKDVKPEDLEKFKKIFYE